MPSLIIGHASALKMLRQAASHPAPGYLLHGPDGIGKRLIGDWFAAQLLASDSLHLASHPDFARLKKEDGEQGITVEAVRALVSRMYLTSAMGGRKVALIEDAEALNEAGMNSFLKAVEEPDEHASYIFISEQPERLPATLHSRLVSIALTTVPSADIRAWLGNENDLALVDRAVAASRGCPGIARRLLKDPQVWQKNEEIARSLLVILRDGPDSRALNELERLAKTMYGSVDSAQAWRGLISACERLLPEIAGDHPEVFSRIGRGLILARRFSIGTLSPHLGLEWSVVEPCYDGDIPSSFHPTYL